MSIWITVIFTCLQTSWTSPVGCAYNIVLNRNAAWRGVGFENSVMW